MTTKEFNKQTLLEKQRYLKQFVSAVPFVTGVLIFELYMIYTIYSVNGHLLECIAYPLDDLGREEAQTLLKGKECVAFDCSNWPGIKEAITKKLMRATGQMN